MKTLTVEAEVHLPESPEPDMLRLDLSVLVRERMIDILVKSYKIPAYMAVRYVSKIRIKDGSDQTV